MKTTLLTTALLLIATLTTFAQNWKKDRPVSGFTGLSVSHGIDVYLTQDGSEKLTIDARGFEENEVKTEIRDGVLRLSIDRKGMNWSWGRDTYVKAYLTFRQLQNLQASGGSDVSGQGSLSFNDLNVSVSGGGDVKLNLKADKLNVDVSGGGDATLEGSARSFNAQGSGGSDLDARRLTAETCVANANGGSDVYVNASESLTLKASGGSGIYYSGRASKVIKSESGGSDITRRD